MASESNGTNIMSQPDSTPESGDSEFAMMYYGLGIVAAAGLLLLAYNIIVIKCCVNRSTRRRVDGAPTTLVMLSRQGRSNQGMAGRRRVEELVSFKYQKDEEAATAAASVGSVECAVCLSMFEEGEEIKQLPRNADGFESWHTFMAHQAGPLLLPSVRWWRGTSSTGLLDMDLDLDLDHGSVSWSSQDLVSWKEQPREGKGEQRQALHLLCIVLVLLLYAMYSNIMECERRWKAMNPEHNFHVFSRQRVAYGDIYGSPSDVR